MRLHLRYRVLKNGSEARRVAGPVPLASLESHLWESANILRGPVDAADFKTYIFPPLFSERISDLDGEEWFGVKEH